MTRPKGTPAKPAAPKLAAAKQQEEKPAELSVTASVTASEPEQALTVSEQTPTVSELAPTKDISQHNFREQVVPSGKLPGSSASASPEPAHLPEIPEKGSQEAKQVGVLPDMKLIVRYVPTLHH